MHATTLANFAYKAVHGEEGKKEDGYNQEGEDTGVLSFVHHYYFMQPRSTVKPQFLNALALE